MYGIKVFRPHASRLYRLARRQLEDPPSRLMTSRFLHNGILESNEFGLEQKVIGVIGSTSRFSDLLDEFTLIAAIKFCREIFNDHWI